MNIYFIICQSAAGHHISCYDEHCFCVDGLVKHARPRAWATAEEAEEFALECGWHPAPDDLVARLAPISPLQY